MASDQGESAIKMARGQSRNGPMINEFVGMRSSSPVGWCLRAVRICYGVDSFDFTPNNGRAPFAVEAFDNAEHPHATKNTKQIPRGVPVFWRSNKDGKPGHIAISTGDGDCWSTDFKRDGFFDKVPIADIAPAWNMTLLGWTEDLNRVRVFVPPRPPSLVTRARALLRRAEEKAGPIRKKQIRAALAALPKK